MNSKLFNTDKFAPPYPLGDFPENFISIVGKEIVYLLCTKATTSLEGVEWERIFAKAIGASWKPSVVGLDDVVLKNCSWSAKTVKGIINKKADPALIGHEVIAIWNARVENVRTRFPYLRTVVLIKSEDLLTLRIFEIETKSYDADLYSWIWNERGNLEGHFKGKHCFTCQPHGSQFTIIEDIPTNCINFKIKSVPKLEEETVLKSIGFDSSWINLL